MRVVGVGSGVVGVASRGSEVVGVGSGVVGVASRGSVVAGVDNNRYREGL